MQKKSGSEKRNLRNRAENIVAQRKGVGEQFDTQRLLHELEVHQVELELQNAELRDAQLQVDSALRRYSDLYHFAPVAYFTLDPTGVITQANVAAVRLLGGEGSKLFGRHFQDYLEETSRQDFVVFQERALRRDRIQSGDLTLSAIDPATQPRTVRLETASTDRAQCMNIVAFDITERMDYERKLQEHQSALEMRDRQKDDFIATLSHEFRNPLAAINNAIAILNHLGSTDPQVNWVGKTIASQIQQLNDLVEDALDVSWISQGKFELKMTHCSVRELMERVLAISHPFIEDLGHSLELDETQEPLMLEIDPARIVQVVDNVLHNAAKYSPKGARIRLSTAREDSVLVIRITDEGIGLAADWLTKVFGLYARGPENPNQLPSGLGIGLTLAERLVQLHRGSIAIHSAGIGFGCEVSIRLPLSTSDPRAQPALADATAELDSPSLRVLVVDDDSAVADSFGVLLRMMGHQVELVLSGEEAQAAARALNPQIIFLDIGMPGLSGYDVLRELRSVPRWQDMPIIAVTGYGQKDDIARSLKAGFDAHLVKPVDMLNLKRLLAQVAAGH